MNPILSRLNTPNNPQPNMLQQFAEFKRSMAGKDPQAMVQQLIQSGKLSQQQFEQLKQQAHYLQSILR